MALVAQEHGGDGRIDAAGHADHDAGGGRGGRAGHWMVR
jgi:hypothetical protein